ncbi:MAG TPA: phosphotransferase [Syntrophales bacterium]|nr:phosphotransferase [Syntrophales bacterium]HRT70873.1 phosphotransferase [Syntrophales bacterium]
MTVEDKEHRSFIGKALGIGGNEAVRITLLFRGGSDRTFYRVHVPGRNSFIFMHYSPGREENNYYVEIAGFLPNIGVRVPAIVGHDRARRFILMEDLGDADLFSFRQAPWSRREELYRKTLGLVLRLHSFPLDAFPFQAVPLAEAFGPSLYRWERDYFRENFVGGLCGVRLDPGEAEDLERELAALAADLEGGSRCLVHRDLQSKNVMVVSGEPALIDFQGMRAGNPFYDLGSLLYDPYVAFTHDERLGLLRFYHRSLGRSLDWPDFQKAFFRASAQRLMQALGAYGFLGLKRGLRGFLEHVPRGLENLIDASTRAGDLPRLRETAVRCREIVSS